MATSIKLDDDLKSRVMRLASGRDRSAHWLMREAIRQYVDREEAREDFHREAVGAWVAYREDGLHLTGTETVEWLGRWGEDAPAPACHD